jgi:hypothetical protein
MGGLFYFYHLVKQEKRGQLLRLANPCYRRQNAREYL